MRVWDPLLRGLHAALIVAIALGWATTAWQVGWHQPVGWLALAVVGVRVVWGFAGPRPARFASFVRGPRATARYAARVLHGRAPRHLGHNPLGGWMTVALLASVVVVAASGWLYTTDWLWGDETVERVHVAGAWTLVGLVVLHVLGVLQASLAHRENLPLAMLTGEKRAPRGDDVDARD